MIATLAKVPGWLLDKLRYAYDRYPAQTLTAVASAVVYVAAWRGIVVEQQDALTAVGYVVPILLAGRVVHNKVEPVKGVRKPTPLKKR